MPAAPAVAVKASQYKSCYKFNSSILRRQDFLFASAQLKRTVWQFEKVHYKNYQFILRSKILHLTDMGF